MSADLILAAVHVLEAHGRVPLDDLARLVGAEPAVVRAHLEAFNAVELPDLVLDPLFRIEPAAGWPDSGPDPDPRDDDLVGFVSTMAGRDLGVAHTDATILGPLVAAADQLRSLEPGNLDLASAVDVLRSSLLANVSGRAGYRTRTVAILQGAANRRHAVRLTYAAAWTPSVGTRVIHPYRVVSTSRGYEVDAGPLDDAGRPRTFLLTGIRDLEVLDATFEVPAEAASAMAANRALTAVTGVAGHRQMWAVRHWAERVDQGEADSADVRFTAWMLPPVADRVALMCLVAGPGIDLDDADLDAGVGAAARELLDHHEL